MAPLTGIIATGIVTSMIKMNVIEDGMKQIRRGLEEDRSGYTKKYHYEKTDKIESGWFSDTKEFKRLDMTCEGRVISSDELHKGFDLILLLEPIAIILLGIAIFGKFKNRYGRKFILALAALLFSIPISFQIKRQVEDNQFEVFREKITVSVKKQNYDNYFGDLAYSTNNSEVKTYTEEIIYKRPLGISSEEDRERIERLGDERVRKYLAIA